MCSRTANGDLLHLDHGQRRGRWRDSLSRMGSNCLASASIGCLFCCQGCNAEKLRNAFVFLPPPSSYMVDSQPQRGHQEDLTEGGGRMVYASECLRSLAYYQEAASQAEVYILRTHRGERIPVVWVRRSGASSASSPPAPGERERPLVLLHCHGNATDIGMMMGPYLEMTNQLGVEVLGVEYSGYGIASGSPSVSNTLADVEAAYDFLVAAGVAPERIVAYGQSVGSGPVLGLAAKRPLGGLVLHSPMLSGIKVIDPEPNACCKPSCVYHCLDFFPNDRRMKSVGCPAFVIHGQLDDIIPFYHGARLAEAAPKQFRWPGYFPRSSGHNDIVEANAPAYFGELNAFLRGAAEKRPMPLATVAGKPLQIEMMESAPVASKDVSVRTLPFAEPAVGPEDGRYQTMRRGHGAKGSARELHPLPSAQAEE